MRSVFSTVGTCKGCDLYKIVVKIMLGKLFLKELKLHLIRAIELNFKARRQSLIFEPLMSGIFVSLGNPFPQGQGRAKLGLTTGSFYSLLSQIPLKQRLCVRFEETT